MIYNFFSDSVGTSTDKATQEQTKKMATTGTQVKVRINVCDLFISKEELLRYFIVQFDLP